MDELELQNLVVSIVADNEDYIDGMKEASKATDDTADAVEDATGEIEDSSEQVGGFAEKVSGYALAAVGAITSIIGAAELKDMFAAFSEAEAIEVKLTAAIKASGQAVDDVLPSYKEWADEIQRSTTVEGDFALGLIKTATNLGLAGDAARKAADDAIALAALNDTSADSMVRFTAALAKGNVEQAMQFARMVPQLRGITDQQEFLAKAQQAITAGWETEQASSQTAAGALKQLENAYGDIKEELGAVVAEGVKPVVDILKDAVALFQMLGPEAKSAIVIIAGLSIALLAVPPILIAINFIWQSMTGGLLLITGLIASVIVGVTALTLSMGGVGAAFQKVKDAAYAAWEWLLPVRKALISLWETIMEGATEAWEWVKQQAVDTWEAITGDAEVNWDQIRGYAVDAIIAIEFGLRNLKPLAERVWLGIKVATVDAVNSMIASINKLLEKVEIATIDLINIEDTRKELENAKEAIGKGFQEFLEEKRKQFFAPDVPDEVKESAKKGGETIGKEMMKGVQQEVQAAQASLVGSADALAKILEYRERLKLKPKLKDTPAAGGVGVGGGGLGAQGASAVAGSGLPPAQFNQGMAAQGQMGEAIKVLMEIRDIAKAQLDKPSLTIAPANL